MCKKHIVPKKGETKVQKLRALGRDFHLQCFKCEDCSLVLKPGVQGKECWPIKNHILCKRYKHESNYSFKLYIVGAITKDKMRVNLRVIN